MHIFLTGLWRSGTSMFLRLFDGHPQIGAMPTETGIIALLEKRLGFMNELKEISSPVQLLCFLAQNQVLRLQDIIRASVKGMTFPPSDIIYPFEFDFDLFANTFYECVKGSESFKELIYGYYHSIKDAWKNKEALSASEVRFVAQRAHRRTRYPGEDSVQFVMNHLDDMVVLEIIRHPVWQINSAMKNGDESLEEAIVAWAFAAADVTKRRQEYSGRYLAVKYEDLVNDVQSTMNMVMDSVGLEMHQALLAPTFNGEKWKGNSLFGAKEALQMTSQMNLSEVQIGYVQKSLSGHMEELNYNKI